MFKSFRIIATAAAFVLAAVPGHALTLDPNNNMVSGGSHVLQDGPYFFGATFSNLDAAGGVFDFTFTNGSGAHQAVALAVGTLLQMTAQFTGGISFAWMNGDSVSFSQGTLAGSFSSLQTILAAGGQDTLRVTWGGVVETIPGGKTNIDISVAPVPLPAGGLLLVGALGGLALLRRRKKA